MKQQEMIELIQSHFPSVGEVEIRLMLNRAMDEFCEESEILSGTATITEQANVRYYPLTASLWNGIANDGDVLKIRKVDYDDTPLRRLVGEIDDIDTSEAS